MTEQELRDLDARVHQDVMRLECHKSDGAWFETNPALPLVNLDGKPFPMLVPAYTTDIAAAWQVVEQLHGRLWFEIHCAGGKRADDTFEVSVYTDYWEQTEPTAVAVAETAPLAICLAALKAVEAKL